MATLASGIAFAVHEPPAPVESTNSERIPFPSGGLLRMKHAIGDVTVEGCDCTDAEITTLKSAKASDKLDKVRVTTETQGNEIVVTTDFPWHRSLPLSSPLGPAVRFGLEYRIKVPRSARLDIEHDVGEVHVDDVRGDIRVNSLQGAIILHLPENGQYGIDAKSDYGAVNSDFAGKEKRSPWLFGVRFLQESPGASQKLHLRIGYGDIVILRIRIPSIPDTQ